MIILRCAAVTAVGLTAAGTCSAFRARLTGFGDAYHILGREQPIVGAPVPANPRLRRTPTGWLASLAARALRECLPDTATRASVARMALVLTLPDPHRRHPASERGGTSALRGAIEQRLGARFHLRSRMLPDGHAGAIAGLAAARELFADPEITHCIVGGVDSLLNHADLDRLISSARLRDERNAQGVIPGEGAAFVLLTRQAAPTGEALAQVRGVGLATEVDTVLGSRRSNGVALRAALEHAAADANCPEATLSLRVSDMNGERYRAWESMMSTARFYRTRRDRLPVWYPAASVGDVGAAAGALGLVIAAAGIAHGHAPGPLVVCEGSSDEGLRAACILAPVPGALSPPFRSKRTWRPAVETV